MGMRLRRLVRRAEGGVRVTLPPAERALLINMAETLRETIRDVDADTPLDQITGRLFPRAYDDPLDEMEYASTALGQLAETKRTMLDTFADSLKGGESRGGRWRNDLDEEQTAAWLTVLQDGRLTLARIVGIETEDDWNRLEVGEDDAAVVLAYLGELLGTLVELLMGGLPDPD